MIKYMFTWLVIASVIYLFKYILSKREVKVAKGTGKRIAVSCSIAGVVVMALYF